MTAGELLASPSLWVTFGVCFIAGCYVKGDVFGALAYGTIAPLFLFLFNVIAVFALSIPALAISKLAPRLWSESCQVFLSLPESLQFVLNPSFLLTASVFVIHCWSAREVSEPDVMDTRRCFRHPDRN